MASFDPPHNPNYNQTTTTTSSLMTSTYAVPVAVPLPHDDDINLGGASAPPTRFGGLGQKERSSYKLPSSRINGAFAPVPETQIQNLVKQGYTRGLATSLAQTIKNFPLRIWVVDNSGSMQHTDGHRFVETRKQQDVKVVNCSRWDEIKGCVEYHAQIAAALEAPTTFRMLNDPHVGPNSQQFGIAETSLDPNVIQEEVSRAVAIMNQSQPGGVTPLIKHLREIKQAVEEMSPELNANGTRVAIILATDGLPTDEHGYNNSAVQQEFVQALRGLESLPVWVVIRLCTDEQSVCDFYNSLDDQLELSLEVLDDFLEEAEEVYEHNPWLNYALPLHRLREMGYHNRVFDMVDERPLTHQEVKDFCSLLLIDRQPYDQLPDPSADWKEFSREIKGLLAKQPGQWNPKKNKLTPWIDVKKLDKIYGDSKWKFWLLLSLPTKVHEGVSVSFIEYEVSTAYSVSGNGEELTLYATAVGRDDNSEAPHASLHVGRPIVRLTRIPSIDVFEEDGNGNESDVDSGEDEWDANERNTDNGIDNSVFALEGSNWKLAEIRGFEAIDKNKRPVTLSFDSDTSVRGFDGCNRFFGAMDVLSGIGVLPSFRVGNVSSTRLGCRGDALRKQMNMFYDVLRSNAVTYNIVNGEVVELELYATNVDGNGRQTQGELLARFKWVETEFW